VSSLPWVIRVTSTRRCQKLHEPTYGWAQNCEIGGTVNTDRCPSFARAIFSSPSHYLISGAAKIVYSEPSSGYTRHALKFQRGLSMQGPHAWQCFQLAKEENQLIKRRFNNSGTGLALSFRPFGQCCLMSANCFSLELLLSLSLCFAVTA
jgi:hypothetical protein